MKTSLLLASSALFIASIQSFVINDNAATNTEPEILKARDKVQQKPTEKRKIGEREYDKNKVASNNIISVPRNFSNENLTTVFAETRNK